MNAMPCADNDYLAEHIRCLLDSYQQLLGKPLTPTPLSPQQLFEAPFALLSHNTEADPIFNYANRTALDLFELDWPQLCRLPSRLSAEPVNQQARAQLLEQVNRQGYIDHYSGIRISSSGRRFRIDNAVVWNLYDAQQRYYGQAACFEHWHFLESD